MTRTSWSKPSSTRSDTSRSISFGLRLILAAIPSTVSVESGLSWKYINNSALVSDPINFSRRSVLVGASCCRCPFWQDHKSAVVMPAYLRFIVFCRGELESALERTRLLLCNSRILLAGARCLSFWECRLFGGLLSCRSLHPGLLVRLRGTLRSWFQAVVCPMGPRLSLVLYSSRLPGILP